MHLRSSSSVRAGLHLIWQMNLSASGALIGWLGICEDSSVYGDSTSIGPVALGAAGPESQGVEGSTFLL